MPTVYFEELNGTDARFDSDEDGIIYEIGEYFAVFIPSAKYDYRFRNHLWDGKIRFANTRKQTIPVGLKGELQKFCAERDYDFVDTTKENPYTTDSLDGFDDWVQTLNLPFPPRDYQIASVKEAIKQKRMIVLSPTGCHAKGTKIVMADGSLKNVENVKLGDFVMGRDGTPREVLRLYHGSAPMYKIIPKRSAPFVVNGDHVLHVWRTDKPHREENITVDEYLASSKSKNHFRMLMLNDRELEFSNQTECPIDPYFMGVYLGDGHTHTCSVTSADIEIEQFLYQFADSNNLIVKKIETESKAYTYNLLCPSEHKVLIEGSHRKRHSLIAQFEQLGLIIGTKETRTTCEEKFIPECYFTASVKDRYQLLAGLIDTDGGLGAIGTYYEYATKSPKLKDGIIRLAKSLGFATSCREKVVNGKIYYRLNILGDIFKIPVRIERKKCNYDFNRNKDPHHEVFSVEPVGNDEYFGFELSGDHLYFTDNFIINHNSGKSFSLYLLLRWHHDKGRRVCLIVPNISLVEQMYSDFANYSKDDPNFNAEESLQMLYAKKSKEIDDSKHLITTWQSLQTYTADVYNSFDVMMADECHRCKASILQKILKQATDVTIRYGFTGSLSAEPTDNLTVTGSLGPVYTATTTTDLQARGELAPLKIYCLTINHTKDDCRYVAKEAKEYQQEIAYLVENDKRNKFIRNMACSLKGVVLVIFKHIEHGHRLYDLIKEKVVDSREVFFIDGSVDDREDIRQAIINGKDAILVASVGTTSTGVNIPNLQHIVLAHPSKSRIQTIQTIGRSLRTHKSKNMAYVYDVIDNLKFGKRRNFVLKHALERFKIYSEQGFDVEFKEVSF